MDHCQSLAGSQSDWILGDGTSLLIQMKKNWSKFQCKIWSIFTIIWSRCVMIWCTIVGHKEGVRGILLLPLGDPESNRGIQQTVMDNAIDVTRLHLHQLWSKVSTVDISQLMSNESLHSAWQIGYDKCEYTAGQRFYKHRAWHQARTWVATIELQHPVLQNMIT